MVMAGHLRREQGAVQAGRAGGEHVDALVEVVVGGRDADLIVGGELPHPVPSRNQRNTRMA